MDSMAYSLINRISRIVVTALVIATVGLALVSTGAVHAQDNPQQEPESLPCQPFGTDLPPSIPEDTIIKVGGSYYRCSRGMWWKVSKVAAGGANANNVLSPTTSTTGGLGPLTSLPAQDKYLEQGRF